MQTATLLPNGDVLVAGGYENNTVGTLASAERYNSATNVWTSAGSLATPRYGHTATMLQSGKVLVVGGDNNTSGILASAELYDPSSGAWSSAGSLSTARSNHTATLLPSGKVLVVGGTGIGPVNFVASAEIYDPTTNSWSSAGSLATPREGHIAVMLPNGKVLVAGGYEYSNDGYFLASAELYDPATNTWSLAAPMTAARVDFTASLLPSGEVLVVGGAGVDARGYEILLSSAELYDPIHNAWIPTGALSTARNGHTSTILPTGQVIVIGGSNANGAIAPAEVYSSANGVWSEPNSYTSEGTSGPATLLPTGKVLISGGGGVVNSSVVALASAELFDPVSNKWSTTGSLSTPRYNFSITLLTSGKALAVGGYDYQGAGYLASNEIYDPTNASWTAVAPMPSPRDDHTATLMPSGKILVTGGANSTGFLASAELYDPKDNTWQSAASMSLPRYMHTATLMASGKVLVAGGENNTGVLAESELYDPATNSWITVSPMTTARGLHTATLLPSGEVLVAGGLGSTNLLSGSPDLASAELYNPVTNTWTAAASMATPRHNQAATLLPSGQVLVSGGTDYNTGSSDAAIGSVESYDPMSNSWTSAGTLANPRSGHSSILMLSGRLLIAGGGNNTNGTNIPSEIYDPGLSPAPSLQPTLVNAALAPTDVLSAASAGTVFAGSAITVTGFMPALEASGGASNSSPGNYPVIQVHRIDNGQIQFLPYDQATIATDTNVTSAANAFGAFAQGPMLVRVWVNGVPSSAEFSTLKLTDEVFRDGFGSVSGQ